MIKWCNVCLEDVYAINNRIALARIHGWIDDFGNWNDAKKGAARFYRDSMDAIHRDWNFYPADFDTQRLYNTCELCYLLLDGYDALLTKEKRDAIIIELKNEYYKKEN